MKIKLPLIFLLGILFLIFPSSVFAAASISTDASSNLSPVNGESFNISASISGAQEGAIYFVKCRIGPDTSSLTEGQTYNLATSVWLNDSGSEGKWIDMPQVVIGTGGIWSGVIQCRVRSDVSSGSKSVGTRACLNSSGSCSDSFPSLNLIAINSLPTPTPSPTATAAATDAAAATTASTPTPTVTPTPTPTPTKKPTPKPTPTPKSEVLGDSSATTGLDFSSSQNAPSATPTPGVDGNSNSGKKFPVLAIILVLSGAGLLGFSVFSFVRSMKKGYTNGSENTPTKIS